MAAEALGAAPGPAAEKEHTSSCFTLATGHSSMKKGLQLFDKGGGKDSVLPQYIRGPSSWSLAGYVSSPLSHNQQQWGEGFPHEYCRSSFVFIYLANFTYLPLSPFACLRKRECMNTSGIEVYDLGNGNILDTLE